MDNQLDNTASNKVANEFQVSAMRSHHLFLSRDWIESLCSVFHFDPVVLESTEGVLPFVRLDNICGKRLIALPYTGCIPIVGHFNQWYAPLAKLIERFPDYSLALRFSCKGTLQAALPDWEVECKGVTYSVATNCNENEIVGRFSQPFSHQARQAQKMGVITRLTRSSDDLNCFYDLYARQRQVKFSLLSPPRRYFKEILDRWFSTGQGFLLGAYVNDTLIAGVLIVEHSGTWHNLFSASDPTFLKHRPNNMLFRDLLFLARSEGIRDVDLGMCWLDDSNVGLRRFKESMGGVGDLVYTARWSPKQHDASREIEGRELMRRLTRQLVNINLSVDEISDFGEILFGYFN